MTDDADDTQLEPREPDPEPRGRSAWLSGGRNDDSILFGSDMEDCFRTTPQLDGIQIPKVLGRYRIVEPIGEGGFGQVVKAFDAELDRFVAIKIPHLRGESSEANILAEARKLASLRHEHVVPVYGSGVDEHQNCYLVSAFVSGQDLRALVRSHGRLPVVRVVEIVSDIARALSHVHENHLVHRDIKPANILIDAEGITYLTDFGISLDRVDLSDANAAGTILYMSPEQAYRNPTADDRSDIYSLGVVLYELLSGHQPFRASTTGDAIQEIRHREIPPLDPSVPRALRVICERMTQRNPDDRYQTASELVEDLDRFLHRARRRDAQGLLESSVERRREVPGAAGLPSVSEWFRILLLTHRSSWTTDQRRLLSDTARRRCVRGAAVLVGVCALFWLTRAESSSRRAEALAARATQETVTRANVEEILRDAKECWPQFVESFASQAGLASSRRSLTLSPGRTASMNTSDTATPARLVPSLMVDLIALGLPRREDFPVRSDVVERVVQSALRAEPAQWDAAGARLRDTGQLPGDRVLEIASRVATEPSVRFRAEAMILRYAPSYADQLRPGATERVVHGMLDERDRPWAQILRSLRTRLAPHVLALFRKGDRRDVAADLFVQLHATGEELGPLIDQADPRQLYELFRDRRVEQFSRAEALRILRDPSSLSRVSREACDPAPLRGRRDRRKRGGVGSAARRHRRRTR